MHTQLKCKLQTVHCRYVCAKAHGKYFVYVWSPGPQKNPQGSYYFFHAYSYENNTLSLSLSLCPWLLCNTHTNTTMIQPELPQHGELAQVVLVIAQCYSLLSLPPHNAICWGGGEGCHQKLAGPGPAFSGEKACKAFLVIHSFPYSIRTSGISPTLSHPNLRIHDCSVHDVYKCHMLYSNQLSFLIHFLWRGQSMGLRVEIRS